MNAKGEIHSRRQHSPYAANWIFFVKKFWYVLKPTINQPTALWKDINHRLDNDGSDSYGDDSVATMSRIRFFIEYKCAQLQDRVRT